MERDFWDYVSILLLIKLSSPRFSDHSSLNQFYWNGYKMIIFKLHFIISISLHYLPGSKEQLSFLFYLWSVWT